MTKKLAALLLVLATLLTPCVAHADTTAPDEGALSVACELPERNAGTEYRLLDGEILTRVPLRAADSLTLRFTPEAGALLLKWYETPPAYTVRRLDAFGALLGEETVSDGICNRLLSFDAGCAAVELSVHEAATLSDVTAYPVGTEPPADVQRWQPSPEQVDLLIVVAEPGAEAQALGGALIGTGMENGLKTAVLYVSDYSKRRRVDEALSGLWALGISEYPIFAGFTCCNYDSEEMLLLDWNDKLLADYLVGAITSLSPKVVVTHGAGGEGLAAHKLTATCVRKAVEECPCVQKLYTFGATEDETPTVLDMNVPLNAYAGRTAAETAQDVYALHASQRIYRRSVDTDGAYTLAYSTLGADTQHNDLLEHVDAASLLSYAPATPTPTPAPPATPTPMSADASLEPMPSVSETTPSDEASASAHPANARVSLLALGGGAALSLLVFLTLYRFIKRKRNTGDAVLACLIPFAVGFVACAFLHAAATKQAALLVNTPAPSPTPRATATAVPTPTNEPTPAPTATLSPQEAFEATFYRLEGDPEEVVVTDSEHGHWAYRSDELGISIERVETTNANGKPIAYFVADIYMKSIDQFRPGFGSIGHTGRGTTAPWRMAREAKAVFWLTGDNMINTEREEKGILIRDGKLYSEADYEDTLALYPDMSMRIFKPNQTDPDDLMNDGVENSFSFGPTLVHDGEINPNAMYHRVRRANPRAGIGYYAPGHYLAIVVDGRQKDYSVGMTTEEFAALFLEYGVVNAYNFDGGLSAGMVFMGEQINRHAGNHVGEKNDISYQRKVPDGLMFGYSELVPSVDDPILNDGNKE